MRVRDCGVPDGQVRAAGARGAGLDQLLKRHRQEHPLLQGDPGGGGLPITNDDLCKAKITYIFSDGYATTSELGRCPAVSLPLIASSWRPDPTVSPRIIKTNVLLAATTGAGAALRPATAHRHSLSGSAYLNNSAATNAVIGFSHGAPDATFSVPFPNPLAPESPSPGTLSVLTVPTQTLTRWATF